MAFKVTHTPNGAPKRDMITGIKDKGRAEKHAAGYTKNYPKDGPFRVEKN